MSVVSIVVNIGGAAQAVRVSTWSVHVSTVQYRDCTVNSWSRLSDPLGGCHPDATCLLDNGAHFEALQALHLNLYFIIRTHFQWRPEYLVFTQSLACNVQYLHGCTFTGTRSCLWPPRGLFPFPVHPVRGTLRFSLTHTLIQYHTAPKLMMRDHMYQSSSAARCQNWLNDGTKQEQECCFAVYGTVLHLG
jgi:hypothetical protein